MLNNNELRKVKEMCEEDQVFGKAYHTLLKERNQMLKDVNYELKNYFTLILGNVQLMETKDESLSENANWLQMVGDIEKLYELLDKFYLYAVCEEVELKTTNIQSMVKNVFQYFHAISIMKELDLELEIAENANEISKTYVTDSMKLKEILTNLIKKAVEAVEVGGKVRVTIEKETEDILKISVINNGPMIQEEKREELFKPKFISEEGSFGLGLPLCAKFAAMLDGTIQVDSTEQETSFQVFLPIAR